MKNNENITEELRTIVALMSYDRSKTLMEQKNSVVLLEYGPPAFIPHWIHNDPDSFNGYPGGVHPNEGIAKATSKFLDAAYEFFSDPHNVLMAVELGAMFIAPFTGPFAPVFLGISVGAGLADSAVYYFVDGDPHSAFMALALTIVPEIKLGKYFKRSNWYIKKYGKKGADEVLEKYNKYQKGDKSIKFTEEEAKFLKEMGEDLAEETTQAFIKQELKTTIKKGLLQIAAEKTLKGLLALIVNTLRFAGKTLKTIGTTGLMLGGTYVTFDQIYLSIWGNDADRQKSEFKKIADLVSKFSGDVKKWLLTLYDELINGIDFEDEKISNEYQKNIVPKNVPILTPEEYEESKNRAVQYRRDNLPGKKITIDMVRSGKEELNYGHQGTAVKQLQQMLIDLGIDVGDKGADGFFGNDTKDAVIEFQTYPDMYGLEDKIMLNNIDGIVGDETIRAIESALKIKKNGR